MPVVNPPPLRRKAVNQLPSVKSRQPVRLPGIKSSSNASTLAQKVGSFNGQRGFGPQAGATKNRLMAARKAAAERRLQSSLKERVNKRRSGK